jgi:Dolichyl-phosphate-mannose-protein mannosyltransferase
VRAQQVVQIPGLKASRLVNIAAASLIGIFCLQAVLAIPRLSATSDEVPHLPSGYSYWKTADFRMNPEHPPLAKLLAAVPLIPLNPQFNTESQSWKAADEVRFGPEFLYGNDADRLLFWGRIPMILIAALGAAATFLWARDLFGPVAGLLALTLYAFCPNLLAHGMLVTTDVPLAAFTVLTLYLFWKRGKNPTWINDFITGLALGAAMASKFSGALVPLIILGFCLVRKEIKSLFIMAAASLLVIEAAYLFSASPLLYFQNMRSVYANKTPAYEFYLLGHFNSHGWWYYFPLAFAVKATLPVLILLVLALAGAVRGFIDRWGEMILLVAVAVFTIAATAGAGQIGVRYIMPVFPLLYIWISRTASDFMKAKWRLAVLGVLLSWHVWSSVSIFPNYIPYFNELAGGPTGGPAILDDSNIDWGQAVKQAAEYVRKRGIRRDQLFFFSPFDAFASQYYGLPASLSNVDVMFRLVYYKPTPGTYIVSSHFATRVGHMYKHFQAYKPIDRIGESLWVYRF